jgi:hypothetical protein
MSRTPGTAVENNFVKGVVTEFSGLNFPENSCQFATNCVFTEKGEVVRRSGIDVEAPRAEFDMGVLVANPKDAYTSFHWRNASPQAGIDFIVVQTKHLLHFYLANSASISTQKKSYILDLNPYKTNSAFSLDQSECQFASGDGQLFVANSFTHTLKILYDSELDTFSVSEVKVQIRDLFVQNDGIPNDAQLSSLGAYPEYHYNLLNQGWKDSDLASYQATRGVYPSKAELTWFYKNAQGFLTFSPAFDFFTTGNSLAPRGYFILDAYNQDREAASGIAGITSLNSKGQRPSVITFFNSRLFLAGVNAEGYTGTIFFSKIIKNRDEEPLFYQIGDPTSEVNFQLLANDGGTFSIPEAGRIFAMKQMKNALLVFAANGVWSVQGNEGVGFTSTDFTIERLSDIRINNSKSFLTVDNVPVFWTPNGIYTLKGSTIGGLEVVSITKPTIQSLYDEIPDECKRFAKGAFDPNTKEAYWIYSKNQSDPTNYTEVLVLRVNTQAFYPFTLTTSIAYVKDIMNYYGFAETETTPDVVSEAGDRIVTGTGDVVVVRQASLTGFKNTFKLLTVIKRPSETQKLTFSDFKPTVFADWSFSVPVQYESSFISAYKLRGEGHRAFQIHYTTVFSKFIENSSCFMSTVWDYSVDPTTSQFSSPQQSIKLDPKRMFNWRKLLVRGNGISVQMKFTSEGTKPFNIIGWSTSESVNDKV